jgi:hypothetical protein
MLHSAINVQDKSSFQATNNSVFVRRQYISCACLMVVNSRSIYQRMFVLFISAVYNKLVNDDLTNHLRHFTGPGLCFSFYFAIFNTATATTPIIDGNLSLLLSIALTNILKTTGPLPVV